MDIEPRSELAATHAAAPAEPLNAQYAVRSLSGRSEKIKPMYEGLTAEDANLARRAESHLAGNTTTKATQTSPRRDGVSSRPPGGRLPETNARCHVEDWPPWPGPTPPAQRDGGIDRC